MSIGAAATVALAALGVRHASAYNLYWDPGQTGTTNSTTAGSGTWDQVTTNWYNTGVTPNADQTFNGSSTTTYYNAAIFDGGSNGATSVNDTYQLTLASSFTVNGFSVQSSGYELVAASAQTVASNSNLLQIQSGVEFSIGNNVTYTDSYSSGNITVGANAASSAASGILNIESGGTFSSIAGRTVGLDGSNTVVNLAGTLSLIGAAASSGGSTGTTALAVGQTSGSNVVLNIIGGTYNYAFTGGGAGLFVGNAGAGTLNLNSGAVTIAAAARGVFLGYSATGSGTFNLNGGTVTTPAVLGNNGTGTFNFNGGTLVPTGANTAFFNSSKITANVLAGGAVINPNSYAITIAQPLLASTTSTGGGLTVTGTGALTLTGTNTYAGPTSVTGGSLILGTAGSINGTSGISINGSAAKFVQTSTVAVAPAINVTNGTLDGTGTVGAVTVGAGTGGNVTNGNGAYVSPLTLGSLTFNGSATDTVLIAGGSSYTSPGQVVTGTLTTPSAAAAVTLNVTAPAASLAVGTYDLLQYGSLSGLGLNAFALGTVTGFGSAEKETLGISGNDLVLTVTSTAVDVWTGKDSSSWQAGATGSSDNWKSSATAAAINYASGDAVQFDDSASNYAVVLSAASVSPSSVAFNNSTAVYTLSGAYGITGSAAVIKNNGGQVTITNSNSYTGGTTINGGTVTINSAASLGAVSSTATINAGTLEAAATFTSARNFVLGSTSSTIKVDPTYTYTLGGTISDGTAPGTLNVTGGGTLALTGSSTYSGGTTVGGGSHVTINSANSLGAVAGAVTVNAGTLEANTTFSEARNINLGATSSTVQVDPGVTYTNSGTVADGASPGTLNVTGGGTLALTGATTFTGGANISNGTVSVDGNLGTTTVNVGANANLVLTGAQATDTNTITGTGNVSNPSTVISFTGTANTFAGTWISSYQYSLNSNVDGNGNSLATSAAAAYVDNSTYSTNGIILSVAGTYNMGSLSGVAGSTLRGGNSTNAPVIVQVGALNTSTTFNGTISDSASSSATTTLALVKVGTGSLTLTGASGYSGGTTVNGGALLVDNTATSGTGSGPVVVNSTGTLGGSGTIQNSTGAVTINAGGTIAAGSSSAAIGTLTTNAQVWNASGGYTVKTNGTTADQLVMTSLTLPATGTFGVTLTALSTSASVAPGTVLVIADDTEGSGTNPFALAATLSKLSLTVNPGVTVTGGGSFAFAEQADTSANGGYDLVLDAVAAAAPEPTSLLLVALAAAPLTLGRRRRSAHVVAV